jgi:hypothetical protein
MAAAAAAAAAAATSAAAEAAAAKQKVKERKRLERNLLKDLSEVPLLTHLLFHHLNRTFVFSLANFEPLTTSYERAAWGH